MTGAFILHLVSRLLRYRNKTISPDLVDEVVLLFHAYTQAIRNGL